MVRSDQEVDEPEGPDYPEESLLPRGIRRMGGVPSSSVGRDSLQRERVLHALPPTVRRSARRVDDGGEGGVAGGGEGGNGEQVGL